MPSPFSERCVPWLDLKSLYKYIFFNNLQWWRRGESEYSGILKTSKLLRNKDAENAQTTKIGPNWNVSGTWDFHPSRNTLYFILNTFNSSDFFTSLDLDVWHGSGKPAAAAGMKKEVSETAAEGKEKLTIWDENAAGQLSDVAQSATNKIKAAADYGAPVVGFLLAHLTSKRD
jgi:hypothetical protein